MNPTPDHYRCRHIHTEGRQCGSPALRGEKLCYQHHALRRPLPRRPDQTLGRPVLPDPEDLHAVQRGLAELLRLAAAGTLEDKHARRLLATLAEASANLARIDRAQYRQRTLALAEARFAARYPEAAAAAGYTPEKAAGCPAFVTASSSLRWASASSHAELPVTDLVHDPELGTIAPGPGLPTALPSQVPVPDPTPLATLAPEGVAEAEAQAAAAVEADFQRREGERDEERRSLRAAARDADLYLQNAKVFLKTPNENSASTPEIHPYLLQNVRSNPKNRKNQQNTNGAHRRAS